MKHQDILQRFIFENIGIRGAWVRLENSFQQAKSKHNYPFWVQQQLGQMLAAATILSTTIKFKGSLILQAQGNGPLQTLVAQSTNNREIRGWSKYQELDLTPINLKQICGAGRLVLTINPEQSESYQGIVSLVGKNFAEALENYFNQSEQLATRFWLFADESHAAGLFLQELPDQAKNQQDWERIEILADTVTEQEILTLPCNEMLYRLFNEEQVRLFQPEPCVFKCSCSAQKIESTLAAMGRSELQDILKEMPEIVVDCEFCSEKYRFDTVDVERIFIDQSSVQQSSTKH